MIRKRGDKWVVEVWDASTRKKVDIGRADTKSAAKKIEADYLAGRTVIGDETCDGFAARWTEAYPRPSEATNMHNAERVQRFGSDFTGRKLTSVTRTEARAWALQNRGRVDAVRAMFNDALDDGIVNGNPFANLRLPQSRGRRDQEPPTVEELHALADLAVQHYGEGFGDEFRAMILWAGYSMMRPGEIFAAKWGNLDGDIYIVREQFNNKTRGLTEPKHGSTGEIFIPKPALEAVHALPRQLRDDLIFHTKRGRPFNNSSLSLAWDPIRRSFGKPDLAFYSLRHAGATYMLNVLGMEPWVIAEQLRHSDGGRLVTQLYGHPSRKVALNRIRSGFTGAAPDAGRDQTGAGLGQVVNLNRTGTSDD